MGAAMSLPMEENVHKATSLTQERGAFPDVSRPYRKSDESANGRCNGSVSSHEPSENQRLDELQDLEPIFEVLEPRVISLVKKEIKFFMKFLSPDHPSCTEGEDEEKEDHHSIRDGVLKIIIHMLRNMNQTQLAHILQTSPLEKEALCQRKHKSKLKKKFQNFHQGISKHGKPTLLNEIFTELCITDGDSGEENKDRKVRLIKTSSVRPGTEDTAIKCNEIFNPVPGQAKAVRTALTEGAAGIGKTVSVQKFIMDWAEGKANDDVQFVFPLPFRELNLLKTKKLSLMELLYQYFPETKEIRFKDIYNYKTIFIFDGLDECRFPLDFQKNEILQDEAEPASVDVLLTNLIKGTLFPSALLWITSRPAAACQIPPEFIDQVTEILGFSDVQKEEYVRKRVHDQELANRIVTHLKSTKSLYKMCHVPALCSISAAVLERKLSEEEPKGVPKNLTQMLIEFLNHQAIQRSKKYQGTVVADPQLTRKSMLVLGKLAFQQLEKGNLVFYDEDLKECGIDVREASLYFGTYNQMFREETVPHLGKVYSFVNLSVQEFFAALFVFMSFILNKRNVLEPKNTDILNFLFKSSMSDVLKSAVDKALLSNDKDMDLFLHFLLVLSLESSQALLPGLVPQPETKQKTIEYIQRKIRENPCLQKSFTLFYCLNELQDFSMVQEVQTYLARKGDNSLSGVRFSPAQWSALVFVLLNSEENLDEFHLSKYSRLEECFIRLFQVVKSSKRAVLSGCNLTEKSCTLLSCALSTRSCNLRELDLGGNRLQDTGLKILCSGLQNRRCKLEILKLYECCISEEGCAALVAALKSNPTHLKELDLGWNKIKDSGVKMLSTLLEDPNCKLEKLQLFCCSITEEGCVFLASALRSNLSSCLRELDLSRNEPGDLGTKLLNALVKDPQSKLTKLQIW